MQLETTGHAASTYQKNPRTIAKALSLIKATPVLTLNGLPYFDETDIEHAIAEIDAEVGRIAETCEQVRTSGILDETAETLRRDEANEMESH